MSKPIISIKDLGKKYMLGMGGGESYRALRDVIANGFKSLVMKNQSQGKQEELWALRNVAFDVYEGQTLGIIGGNGAGKSTLLKLLSSITAPTEGEIMLRGRIASLLEVGTGFHPELTGKENVFMNGSILGMRNSEIKQKYDEIVEFAEVEKFMDTPVKRYSSGMYVRLAFAVAAHLDPEIMLIDEVLAVGDLKFQKKCIGKMDAVAKQGRTVLVVSHNMASILSLCDHAILLDHGALLYEGGTKNVIEKYLEKSSSENGEVVWPDELKAPGDDNVILKAVRIFQEGVDRPRSDVDISKETMIQMEFKVLKKGAKLYSAIWLRTGMGIDVLSSSNAKSMNLSVDPYYGMSYSPGVYTATCRIPANYLNDGRYGVSAIIGMVPNITIINKKDILSFDVNDTGEMREEFSGNWMGVVRPRLAWKTECVKLT